MPKVVLALFLTTVLIAVGIGGYYFYLQASTPIIISNNIKEISIEVDRDILKGLWGETGFLKEGKLAFDPHSDQEFEPDNIIIEFSYGNLETPVLWRILSGEKFLQGFEAQRSGNNYRLSLFLGQDWFNDSLSEEEQSQTINSILGQSAIFVGRVHVAKRQIAGAGELDKLFENLEDMVKKYPVANVKKI
jgi:hypothetical protein